MLLRAENVRGRFVRFTIEDCPVYVTNDLIALVGREGSPIISANTIVRGNDEGSYFEGDAIYEGNTAIGTIIYYKGFKILTIEGKIVNLPTSKNITIKQCINADILRTIVNNKKRTPIMFSFNKECFTIQAFVCKMNGAIAVSSDCISISKIIPQMTMFYTGYDCKGSKIFFGDVIDGGVVELREGKVVTVYDDHVTNLENVLKDMEEM